MAIGAIDKSTEAVVKNFTSVSIEEGFSVIKVIDEVLASNLPAADAAVDATHAKFVNALKSLKDATKLRIEGIYSKLSVAEAKKYATTVFESAYNMAKEKAPRATETVETYAQKAVDVTTSTYSATEKYVAGTYESVNAKVNEAKLATYDAANMRYSQAKDVTAEVVASAQPYVTHALDVSKPYVLKAVEISSPFIATATPYMSPYVEHVKKTIEDNKMVGPYFEVALTKANEVMEGAKSYYMPPAAEPCDLGRD